MARPEEVVADRSDGPTRGQRVLVLGALALLLVGGLGTVEAWPVTAWRLFSETRGAEQEGWSVRAVDGDGTVTAVPLRRLPIGYRLAAWRLEDAERSPAPERTALCRALLDEVRQTRAGAVEIRVLRTRRRLVAGGERSASVEVAAAEVLRCGIGAAP